MDAVVSPSSFPEKTRLAKELEARRRWMEERALVQSGITSGNPELAETIMDLRSVSVSLSSSTSRAASKMQQSTSSVTNLISEEHVTCAICYGVFSHPVALTCGHVFCEECIRTIYKGKPEQYRLYCPLCRQQCSTLNRIYVLDSIAESVRLTRSTAKADGQEEAELSSGEAEIKFPTQVELDILAKRIAIATDAMKQCAQRIQGFNKLTQSYYSSMRKIDDKISQLKEQKELMTVEYKKTAANLERTIEKEKVLHGLIENLETEIQLKQIMIKHGALESTIPDGPQTE